MPIEKTFETGEYIYFVDENTDEVRAATIVSRQNAEVYEVSTGVHDSTICVPARDIFRDICDARTELYARDHKRMMEMHDSIQTVEDLVRFLYNHHVALNRDDEIETCDLHARAVARMKAEELLGIEL